MPTCFIFMPLGGMCFDHTKSRKIARKWHSEFVGPGPLRLIIWLSPAEAEFNVVHSGILNTLSCRSNIRVNSPSSLLGGEIENSTFSLHGNCFILLEAWKSARLTDNLQWFRVTLFQVHGGGQGTGVLPVAAVHHWGAIHHDGQAAPYERPQHARRTAEHAEPHPG